MLICNYICTYDSFYPPASFLCLRSSFQDNLKFSYFLKCFLLENSFSTYNTSDTKFVDFPHQAILQFSVDTNWVPYKPIKF